jgi:hypothetical protein
MLLPTAFVASWAVIASDNSIDDRRLLNRVTMVVACKTALKVKMLTKKGAMLDRTFCERRRRRVGFLAGRWWLWLAGCWPSF